MGLGPINVDKLKAMPIERVIARLNSKQLDYNVLQEKLEKKNKRIMELQNELKKIKSEPQQHGMDPTTYIAQIGHLEEENRKLQIEFDGFKRQANQVMSENYTLSHHLEQLNEQCNTMKRELDGKRRLLDN